MMDTTCIFCQIIDDEIPARKVWENDQYLAFLTRWPNTPGFTVVIPKQHYSSYVFDVPTEIMHGLMDASRQVARLLEKAFTDVGRVGVIFEGFGVDHLHAKLVPMHGTKMESWRPIKSDVDTFFDTYPGYISSHDSYRADDTVLDEIAEKIRAAEQVGNS